ncbi:glutaredoxin family protein [Ferrimonas pelagia]|uniref:Glutaredoxin n=1 Tax=Ferrimonas pelagia TaxID=1177826 RepID=A0ABP9EX32_9GAMM
MSFVRWILGRLILLFNALFAPKRTRRTPELQAKLDQATQHYRLYQYPACPFCVKVRRALRRHNLNVALVDAKQDPHRSELQNQGGRLMVPCLRIDEAGTSRWLYESSDIIAFLQQQLPQHELAAK